MTTKKLLKETINYIIQKLDKQDLNGVLMYLECCSISCPADYVVEKKLGKKIKDKITLVCKCEEHQMCPDENVCWIKIVKERIKI